MFKFLISYFKWVCVKIVNLVGDYGYFLIGSCLFYNIDKKFEFLCIVKFLMVDFFGMLFVLDFIDKIDYKNVFCVRCNYVKN